MTVEDAPLFLLSVVESASNLPLAGVTLAVRTTADSPTTIGTAVTDPSGRAVITIADENSRDALCLAACHGQQLSVVVLAEDGRTVLAQTTIEPPATSMRDRGEGGPTTVAPLAVNASTRHEEPTREQAQQMAAFLASTRAVTVRQAAAQVASPTPDSPVRMWPTSLRTTVLKEFADAAARAPGAPTVEHADWMLDFDAVARGDFSKAAGNFVDDRNSGVREAIDHMIGEWLKPDPEAYRDYLRGVWVAAGQRFDAQNNTVPAVSVLEGQLATRLHQDFHTTDSSEQPAHSLLIAVLVSALTAAIDVGGFGFAVGALPTRAVTDTDLEFLDALVGFSGVDVVELRNRYRIEFDLAAGVMITPIDLNIDALRRFFTDTFQTPPDPFPAQPAATLNAQNPIIWGDAVGTAPFFLEFEEWLERQQTFFPENHYALRRTITQVRSDQRDIIKVQKGTILWSTPMQVFASDTEKVESGNWIETLYPTIDKLNEAHGLFDQGRYREARDAYLATEQLAAAIDRQTVWATPSIYPPNVIGHRDVGLAPRGALAVRDSGALDGFECYFSPPEFPRPDGTGNPLWIQEQQLYELRGELANLWPLLVEVIVPYFVAVASEALGDHGEALRRLGPITGFVVGVGQSTLVVPYPPGTLSQPAVTLFTDQRELPYTVRVHFDQFAEAVPAPPPQRIHPFEHRFFALAQGGAMLEWADELYRSDQPSNIQRAREMYKGVLFLHGEDPGIAPNFPGNQHPRLRVPAWRSSAQVNPAVVSQLSRARLALYEIGAGLNFYGYRADVVPLLRYRTLKAAADRLSISAKGAQDDFLTYVGHVEQADLDMMATRTALTKANAAVGIASEQIQIAQAGVQQAQGQVAAVQAQIAAKQKEIADGDSFFSQFSDYLAGTKDALTSMVKAGAAGDTGAAHSLTYGEALDIAEKSAASGGLKSEALAGLGAGATFMAGFGVWFYASYTTMGAMSDASNQRTAQLHALSDQALPAAQAIVTLKQRDVTIAHHQQEIAQADADLAAQVLRYQATRFLNREFWLAVMRVAERSMRRYLDLGARTSWLAERALAYEQSRTIDIVRLSYFAASLRGVTGADQLQLDLAELEAQRLDGIRQSVPIKYTVSLARDFPIAFGQLKKKGSCSFLTQEQPIRVAHRGTYGYRVRAVTVSVNNADGVLPLRGLLRNNGVSRFSREQPGPPEVLMRFADAVPLSEFSLRGDMQVYELPDETLLPFEGSGIETGWELEFPGIANPTGLGSVADVLITFDMRATYSDELARQQAVTLPAAPVTAARALALSARVHDPAGLRQLSGGAAKATIHFDLSSLELANPAAANRTVTNLSAILVGANGNPIDATLHSATPARSVPFQYDHGIATSNAGALAGGTTPAQALNALVGAPLEQVFELVIDPAVLTGRPPILDAIILVEYTETIPAL